SASTCCAPPWGTSSAERERSRAARPPATRPLARSRPGRYGSGMPRTHLLLPVALVALAACGSDAADAPEAERPLSAIEAFANIPLPPNGVPAGSEGTGEALQLMVTSEFEADSVSAFYRGLLTEEPYHLINESR